MLRVAPGQVLFAGAVGRAFTDARHQRLFALPQEHPLGGGGERPIEAGEVLLQLRRVLFLETLAAQQQQAAHRATGLDLQLLQGALLVVEGGARRQHQQQAVKTEDSEKGRTGHGEILLLSLWISAPRAGALHTVAGHGAPASVRKCDSRSAVGGRAQAGEVENLDAAVAELEDALGFEVLEDLVGGLP